MTKQNLMDFQRMTRKVFRMLLIFMLCSCALITRASWSPNNTRSLTLELFKGSIIEVDKNIGSVFVADPTIVDFHLKAPGLLYLYTKKVGTTSLYVTDRNNKITFKYTIRVTQNLTELKSLLNSIIPGSHITLMSAGDNIVVRGTVRSAAQAQDAKSLLEKYIGDPKKVLTFLHVESPTQVNLHVQVIEVSREVIRSLGIDWSGSFETSHTQIKINPIFVPTDFASTLATDGVKNNLTQFTGLLTRGNFNVTAVVDVLEQNGLVTVLSEPNLTALSGEIATFLVGGEFPIPVPQGSTGTVTVMFKKFGVSLAFKPTILENGKINLQVRPEVSELSDQGAIVLNGFQVPSLSTRRAQTTIELRSGQSFSIAGLLKGNASKLIKQLPGLGDLPILGKLFRSERFRREQTELVIIVTPYIVQPGGNQDFAYPTGDLDADMTASYSKLSSKKNIGFILD